MSPYDLQRQVFIYELIKNIHERMVEKRTAEIGEKGKRSEGCGKCDGY